MQHNNQELSRKDTRKQNIMESGGVGSKYAKTKSGEKLINDKISEALSSIQNNSGLSQEKSEMLKETLKVIFVKALSGHERSIADALTEYDIDTKLHYTFDCKYKECLKQFNIEANYYRHVYELYETELAFCENIEQLAGVLEKNKLQFYHNVNQHLSNESAVHNNSLNKMMKKLAGFSKKSDVSGFNISSARDAKQEMQRLNLLEAQNWKFTAHNLDDFIAHCHDIANPNVRFREILSAYANDFDFNQHDQFSSEFLRSIMDYDFVHLLNSMVVFIVFHTTFINPVSTQALLENIPNTDTDKEHTVLANNFILTIQRIPRWSMIISEMEKVISGMNVSDDNNQLAIASACRKIKRIAALINEEMLINLTMNTDEVNAGIIDTLSQTMICFDRSSFLKAQLNDHNVNNDATSLPEIYDETKEPEKTDVVVEQPIKTAVRMLASKPKANSALFFLDSHHQQNWASSDLPTEKHANTGFVIGVKSKPQPKPAPYANAAPLPGFAVNPLTLVGIRANLKSADTSKKENTSIAQRTNRGGK